MFIIKLVVSPRIKSSFVLFSEAFSVAITDWCLFNLSYGADPDDLNSYFLLIQNRDFTPDPQLLDYYKYNAKIESSIEFDEACLSANI